jgi:L-asparaginase
MAMSAISSGNRTRPRIIIHGGAGNITRDNLPARAREAYKSSLLAVLKSASDLLSTSNAKAIDVATHAIILLENDPLFNAGKGAVFTRAGTIELEASIMVSRGYRKRGVGCMLLKRVKNPIKLARKMLVRGEEEDGGGAYGHCQLSGQALEELAEKWGLEMCDNRYFFTKKRWEQHRKGLEKEGLDNSSFHPFPVGFSDRDESWARNESSWDGQEYLPQGTVGAVVLDSFGDICVATSTGGITNKLPGRIGDTPTIGAGFWAEEWNSRTSDPQFSLNQPLNSIVDRISRGNIADLIYSCFPSFTSYHKLSDLETMKQDSAEKPASSVRRAVGMSGTGNGDSFLRLNAVRTVAALSRFSKPELPLAACVSKIVGPGGEMQDSAGDRWGKTGEGEGGIVGIELLGNRSAVVSDFNCGGMFRAWIDDDGEHHFRIFHED